MCDEVYLNPFANLNQWYTPYGEKIRKITVRSNTVIITKLKVPSINDVALPARASNRFWSDAIRLDTIYVCNVAHD